MTHKLWVILLFLPMDVWPRPNKWLSMLSLPYENRFQTSSNCSAAVIYYPIFHFEFVIVPSRCRMWHRFAITTVCRVVSLWGVTNWQLFTLVLVFPEKMLCCKHMMCIRMWKSASTISFLSLWSFYTALICKATRNYSHKIEIQDIMYTLYSI